MLPLNIAAKTGNTRMRILEDTSAYTFPFEQKSSRDTSSFESNSAVDTFFCHFCRVASGKKFGRGRGDGCLGQEARYEDRYRVAGETVADSAEGQYPIGGIRNDLKC